MTPKQPNVVFVLADDGGYGDLACHGNQYIQTPHLDTLHDQSVRFTNFHVSPCCSPSRAQLMTGRYPNLPESGTRSREDPCSTGMK